jgi:hypothetical protein
MLAPERTDTLYRIGDGAPEDHAWAFPNVWTLEELPSTTRMVIAPESENFGLLLKLIEVMPEPMGLLYVLVVPRGGGQAGRYQSPEPLPREKIQRFLSDLRDFLNKDGRHNLWIRSMSSSAMLVYDRHDLIYAYGLPKQFDQWKQIVEQSGLNDISPKSVEIPSPHSHHYHSVFDAQEQRLLSYLPWLRTPLRDQDET